MSKFNFETFDKLCTQALGSYDVLPPHATETVTVAEQELTEDALHTSARWVTDRVLKDMDELLAVS